MIPAPTLRERSASRGCKPEPAVPFGGSAAALNRHHAVTHPCASPLVESGRSGPDGVVALRAHPRTAETAGWRLDSLRAISCTFSCSPGPLAHREEQGTFNPKVPGSRPGRPTTRTMINYHFQRRKTLCVWLHPTLYTNGGDTRVSRYM